MSIETETKLRETVWQVVHRTPVVDMHTHLFDARFGDLLLWGLEELLTYHYLVAELFRYHPRSVHDPEARLTPAEFYELDKPAQADLIWRALFVEHSPLSESTRGVLTTLGLLGLDPASRDLSAHRAWFAQRSAAEHIDAVFRGANVSSVVMTNDPLDDAERAVWEEDAPGDARFQGALRLDGILNDWKNGAKKLKSLGYRVKSRLDKNTYPEIQRFLHEWCERIGAVYMAVSLPPDFDAFDKSNRSKLIDKCVLPVCRERSIPFAMMIGVKKLVNPELRVAGDAVGKARIDVVEGLCAEYPDNRFLVTLLSRENQHELCVAARKFANLMPFGCWWFLNDPVTIDEMTRMRLELIGTSFVPQHSDARVLDQLLYKWAHTRWIVAHVLQQKYADLFRTGWRPSEPEIERDVANLFGENFKRFLEG